MEKNVVLLKQSHWSCKLSIQKELNWIQKYSLTEILPPQTSLELIKSVWIALQYVLFIWFFIRIFCEGILQMIVEMKTHGLGPD